MYIRICAPSEDSDQPSHLRCMIEIIGLIFIHADKGDSDQTARIGRTFQKVRFFMLWLIRFYGYSV